MTTEEVPTASGTSQSSDIRETRYEEINSALTAYSFKHQTELRLLGTSPEDFVQDCWQNIYRRQGLDRYEDAKCTKLDNVVFNIAQRALIDLRRKKLGAKSRQDVTGRPYVEISIHQPIGNTEDGDFTLGDLLTADSDSTALIAEFLESLPDDQFSPNYSLSKKELFLLSVDKDSEEIAQKVGISSSRIQQLQKEVYRELKKTFLSK